MINIFEYTNFREFLKDRYEEMKMEHSFFSYRYFSRKCGFASPNVLKLVIDGKRNLSSESLETFASFFFKKKREQEFFKNLVHFNQAKTSKEKNEYAQKIMSSSVFKRLHPITQDMYEYYSHWYYVAIREIFSLRSIRFDTELIANLLNPRVSKQKVEQALECLERLGFVKKKNNYYIQANSLVSTGDEVSSTAIANYHREMFELASISIDSVEKRHRDISGVTIPISYEKIEELKFLVAKFRKDLLNLSDEDPNKECVYHLGMQLFPLSQIDEVRK